MVADGRLKPPPMMDKGGTMSDGKREPTTSITHLVKQVVNEVIQENLETITEEVHRKIFPGPEENRGANWSKAEEARLAEEFWFFCEVMGRTHGRTALAINARIKLMFNSKVM